MKLSESLKNFKEEAQKQDRYWVEKTKLDFAMNLERQRKANNLPYAAIAKELNTTAAYISKVFRGDSNLTIESMVKLARATGGRIDINIVYEHESVATPLSNESKNKEKMTANLG